MGFENAGVLTEAGLGTALLLHHSVEWGVKCIRTFFCIHIGKANIVIQFLFHHMVDDVHHAIMLKTFLHMSAATTVSYLRWTSAGTPFSTHSTGNRSNFTGKSGRTTIFSPFLGNSWWMEKWTWNKASYAWNKLCLKSLKRMPTLHVYNHTCAHKTKDDDSTLYCTNSSHCQICSNLYLAQTAIRIQTDGNPFYIIYAHHMHFWSRQGNCFYYVRTAFLPTNITLYALIYINEKAIHLQAVTAIHLQAVMGCAHPIHKLAISLKF